MTATGRFEGFEVDGHRTLVELNDIGEFTFEQIAKVIEKYF